MQTIQPHNNEIGRLAVLHEANILDTPSESAFDAITGAAAELCSMPTSFICLVDSERVWFKSASGLEGVSEIEKSIGFCPHTIQQQGLFEVKNAATDPRFRNNPLVINAPHFKYYAGVPLITSDGYALGTLCVMDYQPREIDSKQVDQLKRLATTVTALIEAKRIKEIKQQSTNHRLGDIIEISPHEVFLIDSSSKKINYANRTAQLSLGYSLNIIKSLKWSDILNHPPTELIDNYLQPNSVSQHTPLEFQSSQTRNDGSQYPVECILQVNGFGNNEFIVISNDISQRKNAENRERTLMNSIAHMNRVNATSALASGLAHELNQPLTAVTQYCDTALSIIEKSTIIDNELHEPLQKAANQSIRAGEIIKRFRAFTENRIPERCLVKAEDLLNETLSLINHDIIQQEINLKINIKENTSFYADPIQIQQVLLNLITNSLQEMEGKNNKSLFIDCTSTPDNHLEFTITDTGDGIDEILLENLITPALSNKKNGTGLGLCICKFIVESHNGRFWHDINYKEGARICFSLPLYK